MAVADRHPVRREGGRLMSKSQAAGEMDANRTESISRQGREPFAAPAGNPRLSGVANMAGASMIEVDRITPDPDQPRKDFDAEALERLAASIKARGQLQPIRVRWAPEVERYVVVVGERRWRAAMKAGIKAVACVIVQGSPTHEDLLEDQLVENAVREDLKPVEQARSYRALMDARGLSIRELADRLNVHFTGVQKSLALLELSESVQASVDGGKLAASTAHAISTIEDPTIQAEVAAKVIHEGMSRAEAIEEVKKAGPRPRKTQAKGKGGKPRPAELPKARSFRTPQGVKIEATSRKGFTPQTLVEALRSALQSAEDESADAAISA